MRYVNGMQASRYTVNKPIYLICSSYISLCIFHNQKKVIVVPYGSLLYVNSYWKYNVIGKRWVWF